MSRILEKVNLFCTQNKINLFGITTAEPFENLRTILKETNHNLKGFTEQDIEKRISPKLLMPNASSIITIGIDYSCILPDIIDSEPRGVMSRLTFGLDYHIVLRNKVKQLADFLSQFEYFEYNIFVDTGPLVDKEIAVRSGIGYYGKNNCIISKQYGSFFNIGYMLTTLKLNDDSNKNSNNDICGNCSACLKYCPTGAISKNNFFDPSKCISYLTQTKTELTINQQKQMGTHIYGCDICQNVCHHNKISGNVKIADVNYAYPLLNEIISMTNSEYKKRYKTTACGWLGKKKLQQNAAMALDNINKNK